MLGTCYLLEHTRRRGVGSWSGVGQRQGCLLYKSVSPTAEVGAHPLEGPKSAKIPRVPYIGQGRSRNIKTTLVISNRGGDIGGKGDTGTWFQKHLKAKGAQRVKISSEISNRRKLLPPAEQEAPREGGGISTAQEHTHCTRGSS